MEMQMTQKSLSLFVSAACAALFAAAPAHAAVDVAAAKALAKSNDCLKCHAADKD